jgi:CheY-like chemotaxis protein
VKLFVESSAKLPIVSIAVAFRSGSTFDPVGKEGLARTTAEALRLLSGRRFGRIISNMGRKEADRHDPAAGLTLIRKLRDSPVNTRIIIFCDANEAATYREVALNDGAYAVTSSPILLLAALDLEGSEATLAQAVNS